MMCDSSLSRCVRSSSTVETVDMRPMARDVNQRIIEDDGALPHFARASQNITATTALLRGLPEPVTPEDHRAYREIHTLLERAVVQQEESSQSWRCELDASRRTPSG